MFNYSKFRGDPSGCVPFNFSLILKSAILNLVLLSAILLITLFIGFITPVSNVFTVVEPPMKTPRHIELDNQHGYSPAEEEELQDEMNKYEKKWNEKSLQIKEKTPANHGLKIIAERMQIMFIFAILIFAIFFKLNSYLDLLAICSLLLLYTVIIPILKLKGTLP